MRYLSVRQRPLARLIPLFAALALLLSSATTAPAQTGPDYAVPEGWFFTQTGGGEGKGYAIRDAGTDSGGRTVRFWTEFQRLGGVATLGYPIGQPYVGSDGFIYQPFQRGELQWRPESSSAVLSNTFEILQNSGRDDWLSESKGVPKPISDDGSGGDFAKAVATRIGWLTDDAIRAKFLANPNPQAIPSWNRDRSIELYGLPMSMPEKRGPFVAQRFQRITFQLWVEDVTGMPPRGSVVGVLGGELLNEAELLPASATQPLGPGGAAIQPTATPTAAATPTQVPPPAPTFQWRVANVQGYPNCGTTYMRAFAQDRDGNGVNGVKIKSWNDFGNEFVETTRNYQDKDGYWDRIIGPGVRGGVWYAAVIDDAGGQISEQATIRFTNSCDPDAGNVQEAEVIFRMN